MTIRRRVLVANRAQGGVAGSGGAGGEGIGGGIYIVPGGTVCVDALTLILANDASTSDDNVFGELCYL